ARDVPDGRPRPGGVWPALRPLAGAGGRDEPPARGNGGRRAALRRRALHRAVVAGARGDSQLAAALRAEPRLAYVLVGPPAGVGAVLPARFSRRPAPQLGVPFPIFRGTRSLSPIALPGDFLPRAGARRGHRPPPATMAVLPV